MRGGFSDTKKADAITAYFNPKNLLLIPHV